MVKEGTRLPSALRVSRDACVESRKYECLCFSLGGTRAIEGLMTVEKVTENPPQPKKRKKKTRVRLESSDFKIKMDDKEQRALNT